MRLHERLGLRVPPDLIQIAVLDPEMRSMVGGLHHFAASVEDLNASGLRLRTVVILENKETGYAITGDLAGTVVCHGAGFSIVNYARVTWIRNAPQVIYWGDIDAPGLQFVSDLRGLGIAARTVLMDRATLERYRHLAVTGAGPARQELTVSACRRIWLISAAAARRSARSGDSATMRSQARNRAASSGHHATATQLNQCSTKYRAGSRLYSSRARAVAAVQSASNLARAAGSRRATAARIAAGSRSGSGTTGCSPDTGRWFMKPMLTYPSDSRQASSRLRVHDNFVGERDRLAGVAGQAGTIWL
jgi:hypothetical protein